MADNTSVTPGRGLKIATDDIGGVHHQRMKLTVGPDGEGEDLRPGQRDKAHSLPMTLASDDDVHGKLGTKVTAVSALGAGGTGIIGWLSQIWDVIKGTLAVNQVSAAYDVAVTITRPANVAPYTAKDVLGGAQSFASIGPSAAAIMITGAQLEIDIATIPSGMTGFVLHLYNVTPPSAIADNGAFTLPSGDRAAYLGFIDLGSPENLGATLYVEATNINKQVKLSGTGLFAYLVTTGGFTPAANSEVYKLTLHTQAV